MKMTMIGTVIIQTFFRYQCNARSERYAVVLMKDANLYMAPHNLIEFYGRNGAFYTLQLQTITSDGQVD